MATRKSRIKSIKKCSRKKRTHKRRTHKRRRIKKGGSETITITQSQSQSQSPLPKILHLRMPPSDQEYSGQPNPLVTIKDVRNNLQHMQDIVMDKIESNYQYFTMMKVNDDFERIMEMLFTNNIYGPKTLIGGGDECNGEILLDNDNTNSFKMMSRLKNFVEIKHDFKKKTEAENYHLNFETELLNASKKIMGTLSVPTSSANVDDTKIYMFYSQILQNYNSETTSDHEREKMYMKAMIEYMNANCGVINSLHLSKYISDSKEHGKLYIEDAELDVEKKKSVYTYNSEAESEKIYISTIDNKPIGKVFTIEQALFAFSDNSISDKILYPHINDVPDDKIINIEGDIAPFSDIMSKGKINTIPSFMDPANGSYEFNKDAIQPDGSDNGLRIRIQELQSLQHIYSYPFLRELANSIDDFCSYYGSVIKIDMSGVNKEIKNMGEFESECDNYIRTGIPGSTDPTGILTEFPIKLGVGDQKGIVSFTMKGLTGKPPQTLELMVRDTTIESISSFLNHRDYFPYYYELVKSKVQITLQHLEDQFPNFTKRHSRIYLFGKAIYDNIPPAIRETLIDTLDISDKISSEVQLLCIIIVSLKAFGDASQVNYSKRVNNYLKNQIKFPVGIGIRTTDKNVFGESILFNNPFWFMNNGLKPHSDWIDKIFPDNKATFDSYKIFITNCDKSNEKIYYDEIIKNLKRYELLSEGKADMTSFQLMKKPTTKRGNIVIDSDSDSDSDDEIKPEPEPESTEFKLTRGVMESIHEKFAIIRGTLSDAGNKRIDDLLDLNVPEGEDEIETYKHRLTELNIFTSTLNDYMRIVVVQNSDGKTHMQGLIDKYVEETSSLVSKLLIIQKHTNGFVTNQKQLLERIGKINDFVSSEKLKKIHNGLAVWVNENLNHVSVEKLNNQIKDYNGHISNFINGIPETFKKIETRTTSRIKKDVDYTNLGDSNKILHTWSIDHINNDRRFMDTILKPYRELVPNGLNLQDIVKGEHQSALNDEENKPEYITNQLEKINKIMKELNNYIDMADINVDEFIINDIKSKTTTIKEILTKLSLYKYNAYGKMKKSVSDDTMLFLYRGEVKRTIFTPGAKILKVSVIRFSLAKEVIITDPTIINNMIKMNKGRISFLPILNVISTEDIGEDADEPEYDFIPALVVDADDIGIIGKDTLLDSSKLTHDFQKENHDLVDIISKSKRMKRSGHAEIDKANILPNRVNTKSAIASDDRLRLVVPVEGGKKTRRKRRGKKGKKGKTRKRRSTRKRRRMK